MENIIIPVVSEEMIAFANENVKRKNSRILIGVVENLSSSIKLPKEFNGKLKVFKNGTYKEEIINSFNNDIDEGKTLICRKAISSQEINQFFESESDITICAEKRSKIKNFFFKIWQYFIRLLFGFEFFDGDISIVCFNTNLFPVISNLNNLSYSSRVNKWKYVTISTIETAEPPALKEYSKTRSIANVCAWILLLMAVIVSTIIFFLSYQAKFLTCTLFACAILLALVGVFVSIAIHTLNVRTGKRSFDKGKAIK